MAEVIWSEPALSDLDAIADTIALDNPEAARRLVQRVFHHVGQLEDHPRSGSKPPELKGWRYRQIVEPPCRVFYREHSGRVFSLVCHAGRASSTPRDSWRNVTRGKAGPKKPPETKRTERGMMKKSGAQQEPSPSQMIDSKIKELDDWRGRLLARLRTLIRQADPKVVEEWKWRVPVWSHDVRGRAIRVQTSTRLADGRWPPRNSVLNRTWTRAARVPGAVESACASTPVSVRPLDSHFDGKILVAVHLLRRSSGLARCLRVEEHCRVHLG